MTQSPLKKKKVMSTHSTCGRKQCPGVFLGFRPSCRCRPVCQQLPSIPAFSLSITFYGDAVVLCKQWEAALTAKEGRSPHQSRTKEICPPHFLQVFSCWNLKLKPATWRWLFFKNQLDEYLKSKMTTDPRHLDLSRYRLQPLLPGSIPWFVGCVSLTVSHLAFIFSFSNLANSRRSWIIMRSFQMSSKARPIRTIPATTPATMGTMSGPSVQPEPDEKAKLQVDSLV